MISIGNLLAAVERGNGRETVMALRRLESAINDQERHTRASAAPAVGSSVTTSSSGVAITHAAMVSGLNGTGVPGRAAAFSVDLKYEASGLHPAPETVAIADLGGGIYTLKYTPTHLGSLYWLRFTVSDGAGGQLVASPPEFQDIAV